MDNQVDIKKVVGGGALIALFLFREAIAWLLGEALNILPIPRDNGGRIIMSEIPWGDIIAWAVLAVGMGFVIWGVLGKGRSQNAGRSVEASKPGLSEQDATKLINAHMIAWESEKLSAKFATHAQMHGHDEKLADLGAKVKFVRDMAEGSQEYAEKRFGDVGIDIRSVEEQIAQLRRDFEGWVQQNTRSQGQRFRNVDGGFRALGDREKLTAIAGRIEDGAKWLLQTSEGKKLNWMQFEKKRTMWRDDVTAYGEAASHYFPDVPEKICNVPAAKLSGHWPEDRGLFPNDDALIAHRTVFVMMQNFREQHGKVMNCVNSFAFNHPSMKGIPDD